MKHSNLLFLVIGVTIIFFGCAKDDFLTPDLDQNDQVTSTLKGAKTSPKLIGTTYANFTFTPPTFWNGTIDFGVEGKYGLTFISLTAPREFSQASPFEEDFIIYKLGTDWKNPENVYLMGSNSGVVTYANKAPDPVKFRANGKVEEAYGPLEMWQDRNVHLSGVVTFPTDYVGLPEAAIGTFRIN